MLILAKLPVDWVSDWFLASTGRFTIWSISSSLNVVVTKKKMIKMNMTSIMLEILIMSPS